MEKIINFNSKNDERGDLIPVNLFNKIPFIIKRFFFLKNLNNLERGNHANRKCKEVLFPVSGSFKLILDNGKKKTEYFLNDVSKAIYIPNYYWLKLKDFSKDCIILVICSHEHDVKDHIKKYDLFLNEIKENNVIDKINYFSLDKQIKGIKKNIIRRIEKILDSSTFVQGEDVVEFENKFSIFNNTKYCIGVSNGCSAIKIAIKSLQLKNPKVIVQANTYVAVPIVCEQLKIPYDIIDIDQNLLLDLSKLENYLIKFNNQNNSIEHDLIVIIVHLYGNSVDMDKLLYLKNKYKFKLIEDAAQAHGSTYNGIKLGSYGDLGCFSFYPSKNLGAFGEAGAIITNNYDYYNYCKLYRNYGSNGRYKFEIIGSNEKIDNLQGAILSVKIDYLHFWNDKRRYLANIYYLHINENSNLRTLKSIENCNSNYHLFIIICNNRNKLKKYLENNNISCGIHYPKPFYDYKPYKHVKISDCKIMNNFKHKLLSLPMYPELTINEVKKVCLKINEFYKNINIIKKV